MTHPADITAIRALPGPRDIPRLRGVGTEGKVWVTKACLAKRDPGVYQQDVVSIYDTGHAVRAKEGSMVPLMMGRDCFLTFEDAIAWAETERLNTIEKLETELIRLKSLNIYTAKGHEG